MVGVAFFLVTIPFRHVSENLTIRNRYISPTFCSNIGNPASSFIKSKRVNFLRRRFQRTFNNDQLRQWRKKLASGSQQKLLDLSVRGKSKYWEGILQSNKKNSILCIYCTKQQQVKQDRKYYLQYLNSRGHTLYRHRHIHAS